jgi:hypothetical protein
MGLHQSRLREFVDELRPEEKETIISSIRTLIATETETEGKRLYLSVEYKCEETDFSELFTKLKQTVHVINFFGGKWEISFCDDPSSSDYYIRASLVSQKGSARKVFSMNLTGRYSLDTVLSTDHYVSYDQRPVSLAQAGKILRSMGY